MSQIGRHFRLSEQRDSGVFCSDDGAYLGRIPLLERDSGKEWHPRPVSDLNRDLSKRYGVPVEFGRKMDGLRAIARALGGRDLIYARIATLHLEMPDPPPLAKSPQNASEIVDLARQLRASGLLKPHWDPTKHPRWPAGSPGSVGGEFAPAGTVSDDSAAAGQSAGGGSAAEPSASIIPAQITIPVPFELPGIPFPSEILPPPVIPDIYPRDLPRNPYPDRPECEQEWAEATDFCLKLKTRNLLGRGDYRGSGRTLYQCIMGRVSQDCGGNSTGV